MAFNTRGESDSQLDAQLDLFLQQIIEQEDLCDNPLDVSNTHLTTASWARSTPQERLLQPSAIPTYSGVPLAHYPNISAPVTALPQAVPAYSQSPPRLLDLHLLSAMYSSSIARAPPMLQSEPPPLHSQAPPAALQLVNASSHPPATASALQPVIASSLQPVSASSHATAAYYEAQWNALRQAASAQTQTQHSTHQDHATVLPSVAPGGSNLHTMAPSTSGGAKKRSHAWSEKNRRAQQRFRDRQKACIFCSVTFGRHHTTSMLQVLMHLLTEHYIACQILTRYNTKLSLGRLLGLVQHSLNAVALVSMIHVSGVCCLCTHLRTFPHREAQTPQPS